MEGVLPSSVAQEVFLGGGDNHQINRFASGVSEQRSAHAPISSSSPLPFLLAVGQQQQQQQQQQQAASIAVSVLVVPADRTTASSGCWGFADSCAT